MDNSIYQFDNGFCHMLLVSYVIIFFKPSKRRGPEEPKIFLKLLKLEAKAIQNQGRDKCENRLYGEDFATHCKTKKEDDFRGPEENGNECTWR